MNYEELDEHLREYEESELYYRAYFEAAKSPKTYEAFIQNLDFDYIKEKKIILPEAGLNMNSSYMDESYMDELSYSFHKTKQNVFITKHHRYTPAFNHKHFYFEICYIYSGSFTQNISGNEIVLREGDVFILSPEVEHSVGIFDDTILINFMVRRSTFHETFMNVLSEENILSSFFTKILYTKNYNNYIIFRTSNNAAIKKILSDMIIEDMENKKYSNKILDNLLMVFFAYLLRDETIQVELPEELQKSNKHLTSILTYIQANYKTVTLNDLSKQFHFTTPYLSKLIKVNTGHSFKEMIQKIKFDKAIELLTSTDLKVKDISDAIGYENNTHFIRSFKKAYGVSPNQYRQKNRK